MYGEMPECCQQAEDKEKHHAATGLRYHSVAKNSPRREAKYAGQKCMAVILPNAATSTFHMLERIKERAPEEKHVEERGNHPISIIGNSKKRMVGFTRNFRNHTP